jgi:hypothetical protein
MASIVFKNAIVNKTNQEGEDDMWFGLSDLTRSQIKTGLMAQLGCEQEQNIKNAGLCLAALAFVELPRG